MELHRFNPLAKEAERFLLELHHRFQSQRKMLLEKRKEGVELQFANESVAIRNDPKWRVQPPPRDLEIRSVEITGPVERKMMINALNSGANVFMADFEDSLSPTWENIIQGQKNIYDAVRQELFYESPKGKRYQLNKETATLMVRPRGLHLNEKHFLVDGEPISAYLFDLGLTLFHNAHALLKRGSGPYFYFPKLERGIEADFCREVLEYLEERLKLPPQSIKVTVLIETIGAAFQMEEILYALRNYCIGLNAGRWDYLFSIIRATADSEVILPDRDQLTMTVPFMRAYTALLVETCQRRKAQAMGGMAAFIPSRKDADLNKKALEKVQEDKLREVMEGFQGTWVAHPDLVMLAKEVFQQGAIQKPAAPDIAALSRFNVPGGLITLKGVKENIYVALHYLAAWLEGSGAVALHHLMEDMATAEIARSELWQWQNRNVATQEGVRVNKTLLQSLIAEEVAQNPSESILSAAEILERVIFNETFLPFLSIEAYQQL